ncbi:hypothetical protein C8R44DRAFT_197717 [Mycena epipterygia]|nr:hypothetical protein C8R44DRAFT_197717 [Mycena epipterygia]
MYAKQTEDGPDEDVQLKLADTYIVLGDVSLETEKIDQASTAYEAGLAPKGELLPRSSRQIAEVHKLSMVFDLTSITHAERAGEHRVPAGGACEPFYLVGPARSERQGQRQDAARARRPCRQHVRRADHEGICGAEGRFGAQDCFLLVPRLTNGCRWESFRRGRTSRRKTRRRSSRRCSRSLYSAARQQGDTFARVEAALIPQARIRALCSVCGWVGPVGQAYAAVLVRERQPRSYVQ